MAEIDDTRSSAAIPDNSEPERTSSETETSSGGEENQPLENCSDATFIGWQESPSGAVLPLYNVTAEGHPYYGSTVGEKTLMKYNLRIPQTPSPPEKK